MENYINASVGDENSAPLYEFLISNKRATSGQVESVLKKLGEYCTDLYRAYSFRTHENVLSEEYYDSYMSCVPEVIEYIDSLYDVIYKTIYQNREFLIYSRIDLHREIREVVSIKRHWQINDEYELCIVQYIVTQEAALMTRVKDTLSLLYKDRISEDYIKLVLAKLKFMREHRYIDENYKTTYEKCPNGKPRSEFLNVVCNLIEELGAQDYTKPLLLDFIESLFDSKMPNRNSIRTKLYDLL